MDDMFLKFLGIRVFISCIGFAGNVYLIFTIIQAKLSPVKSFELFLLGLATANVEEIIIVNIYDIIIIQTSGTISSSWMCHTLKFLTALGEISSILFTVLISVFRYQKLRDTNKRVNLPHYLDSNRAAWMVSGICVMISVLLSVPLFFINLQRPAGNFTSDSCPPDFFLCGEDYCPVVNRVYKYLFVVICNLLPLSFVTVSSCLIIKALLSRGSVTPVKSISGLDHFGRKGRRLRLKRSTMGVLAAMMLFQVDWTLYLAFQLISKPTDDDFWVEMEFFISTSYTSISPYVYGIGNNLFSLRNIMKR